MRCNLIESLKHYSVFLVAPVILLMTQGQAKAILNIRIFDDGPNLKWTVDGALNQLATPKGNGFCGVSGALVGEFSNTNISSTICSGGNQTFDLYSISSASAGFGGTGSLFGPNSVSGPGFWFAGSAYNGDTLYKSAVGMPAGYTPGTSYASSATFNGKSLASEGFTTTGLVGTWTLDGTTESINVYIGPAPGPLPLLGAGAAFGWSRRLRRRIASSSLPSTRA